MNAFTIIQVTDELTDINPKYLKFVGGFMKSKYLNYWVVLLQVCGSLLHYGTPWRDKNHQRSSLNLEQWWAVVLLPSSAPRKSQK